MKIPFRNVRAYFFIKKRNLALICLLIAPEWLLIITSPARK